MLRTAAAVVAPATIASAAASGMLHPRAIVIADPRPALLLALRLGIFAREGRVTVSRDCFGLDGEFVLELSAWPRRRRDHSFGFRICFFFGEFLLFCFGFNFAFGRVKFRFGGICLGKDSVLRFSRSFFALSFGNPLS
jgi:hypothetical protein